MVEKIFPMPVKKNKYGQDVARISATNYYKQILEEVQEAFQAAIVGDTIKILRNEGCGQCVDTIEDEICDANEAEELADIITCCVTRLEILGYDENARQKIYQRVNEKNRKRGYFRE